MPEQSELCSVFLQKNIRPLPCPPLAQKVTIAAAIHYFKRGHYVSASLLTFCGMRLRCGKLNRMSFYQRYVHRGKVRLTQFFF